MIATSRIHGAPGSQQKREERFGEMGDKVYMLNVLWFKQDGGAEKYAEYAVAAAPFVEGLGGRLVESYTPQGTLIGEWDPACASSSNGRTGRRS